MTDLARLPERDGWDCFVAYDGDVPAAAGGALSSPRASAGSASPRPCRNTEARRVRARSSLPGSVRAARGRLRGWP